ncbi:MAG: Gfo/Idh/MocA family oxidoreductase [Pseudomonadota bacterium]
MSGVPPVRIVVVGAGLIGKRHARVVAGHADCALTAIVDPDQNTHAIAEELGSQAYGALEDLPEGACDAVIVAAPNALHLPLGLACLERGLPCLIEKPIADSIASGRRLSDAFTSAGVPLLIGHHRRYHPFVETARSLIESGEIGTPVFASIVWAVRKPHSYFEQGVWRLENDGGPLLINLIHEIDLMRCIFGPLDTVQAIVSNRQRGGPVEDTAGILVQFESGVLATVALSDAALTPWSFEGASAENPNIAETGVSSWRIGCSHGAFEFPGLRVWRHAEAGEGDWSKPLTDATIDVEQVAPLQRQLSHFVTLVRGEIEHPIVGGQEGVMSLQAIAAIRQSAQSGHLVAVATATDSVLSDNGKRYS